MLAPPDTLVAELTYRCPLRCGYCSNPTKYTAATLPTDAWIRVVVEAAELGVLQLHLSGGEPLLRDDLEQVVAAARAAGLYVNLITSGIPLTRDRLRALARAGVDHVQLSLQAATAAACDAIAGAAVFDDKLAVAEWVKSQGLPLTLNVVVQRGNIDELPDIIALAEAIDADRLELANTQYLGWALANREALLPSASQLARARATAAAARARLARRMDVVFVLPDYLAGRARACMGGWGRRYLVVAPDGSVLPCQAAHAIAGLAWERAGERPLAAIWRDSPSLARFRGDDWMPATCKRCDDRERDFGGCRCQAFALTGDAAAVDPACPKSPAHALVRDAVAAAGQKPARGSYRRLRLID
jgi:pyrroloquinoline quinone biosynthesis protein E